MALPISVFRCYSGSELFFSWLGSFAAIIFVAKQAPHDNIVNEMPRYIIEMIIKVLDMHLPDGNCEPHEVYDQQNY